MYNFLGNKIHIKFIISVLMMFLILACNNANESITLELVDQPIGEARDLIKDPISEANTSVAEPVISQARDIVIAPIVEARSIIAVPINEAQEAINQLIPTPSPQVSNPATIMTITADIQSINNQRIPTSELSITDVRYQGASLSTRESVDLIKTYLLSNFCGDSLTITDTWESNFDVANDIWTVIKKNNISNMSWILNDKTLEIVSSQGLC